MHRIEGFAIVVGVLLVVAVPTAVHGWPTSVQGNVFVALTLVAGFSLTRWRDRPRITAVLTLGLLLAAGAVGGPFPDPALVILSAGCAVLSLGWSGRAAWLVALCAATYLVLLYVVVDMNSWVAAIMFTLPPFAAGTVFRLRRETSDELARRVRDLEDERELYAELALRHERARIASELHDIVGHAISVMVIQAAAGQRLVDSDPRRARDTFTTISESARRGTQDLERLVELLDGPPGAELSLVEEVVTLAGRTGLRVSCRFEGDRDAVSQSVAHLAFRVVQESLTNALRYAPGADVRVVIRVDPAGPDVSVRVENERGIQSPAAHLGGGSGLLGLRERVEALGGRFSAGESDVGGWSVEARLPRHAARC
ncbi:putative Histidine kinase [Nostocoides japonicum T1-X7]|uniref:histidine kinase n=1 Tax=Nostocoides japonicum T1-X7 TaxID=1194083 RepID=A0A077M556_9MICO|nr:histidine kinase [Tetrasphaera japonica]CCH80192.1 putative Histidine kinase [Tetrasphaera japonica T1-X7]